MPNVIQYTHKVGSTVIPEIFALTLFGYKILVLKMFVLYDDLPRIQLLTTCTCVEKHFVCLIFLALGNSKIFYE